MHSPPALQALVHGAGPTGALAALALADAGWQPTVRDPLNAVQLVQRSRAYALNHSSQQLLETLGLWSLLQPQMVPFHRLELCDLALAEQVHFSSADLPRGRRGSAVGWIVQHQVLMPALLNQLRIHPAITVQLGWTAADGLRSQAAVHHLMVAADGPQSPQRHDLGVGTFDWPYKQNCLTSQVALRGSDSDQAWELFRPEGPFAVLPLGRGTFQLVWSAPAARCRQLEGQTDVAFLDSLAAALPDRFQPDVLLEPPRAFPVAWMLAHRLSRGSTVLLGESAHRCHPVGGQGLNLCWRDVAVLHRLARRVSGGRLPAQRLPSAYGRRRWPDLLLTLLFTDLLVRLFSNRSALLLPLRHLLLALLRRMPVLRRLSLGSMTLGPCRPWSG